MDFLTTVPQLIRRVRCLSTKHGYFLLKLTFWRPYTNKAHFSNMKTCSGPWLRCYFCLNGNVLHLGKNANIDVHSPSFWIQTSWLRIWWFWWSYPPLSLHLTWKGTPLLFTPILLGKCFLLPTCLHTLSFTTRFSCSWVWLPLVTFKRQKLKQGVFYTSCCCPSGWKRLQLHFDMMY